MALAIPPLIRRGLSRIIPARSRKSSIASASSVSRSSRSRAAEPMPGILPLRCRSGCDIVAHARSHRRGSGGNPVCTADPAALEAGLAQQVGAPRVFWAMPEGGVAAEVPGFIDRPADEGAHASSSPDSAAMRAAWRASRRLLRCARAGLGFPRACVLLLRRGDKLVPPAQGEYWAGKVAGKVTFRRYPGEGHDVQYRHWTSCCSMLRAMVIARWCAGAARHSSRRVWSIRQGFGGRNAGRLCMADRALNCHDAMH